MAALPIGSTTILFLLIVESKGLGFFFMKNKRDVAHSLVRHDYMSSAENG